MNWLAHVAGLDDASGHWYLFWSGIAGELPEFAAVIIVWRKVNCHAKGCWRIGLHRTEPGWVVCRKHHPDLPDKPPRPEDIRTAGVMGE